MTPTEKYVAIARALAEDTGVQALVVAGVPATPFLDSLGRGEGHRDPADRRVEGHLVGATL